MNNQNDNIQYWHNDTSYQHRHKEREKDKEMRQKVSILSFHNKEMYKIIFDTTKHCKLGMFLTYKILYFLFAKLTPYLTCAYSSYIAYGILYYILLNNMDTFAF